MLSALDIHIYKFHYDNDQLADDVADLAFRYMSRTFSNRDGAKQIHMNSKASPRLKNIVDDFKHLLDVKTGLDGELYYWFNVNVPGSYNAMHDHANTGISGCYYISVPENSGDIIFYKDKKQYPYTPNAGDLITFPSNLLHSVEKNNSSFDRITMAFNYYATRTSRQTT